MVFFLDNLGECFAEAFRMIANQINYGSKVRIIYNSSSSLESQQNKLQLLLKLFVVLGLDSVYNLFSILVSYISLVIFGGTMANVIFAFVFQMVGKSFLFYLFYLLLSSEKFAENKQSQSKYVTNLFQQKKQTKNQNLIVLS